MRTFLLAALAVLTFTATATADANDLGNIVAQGPLAVDMTYLVYKDGAAVKVAPVGFSSGNGDANAAVIANMTGQSAPFDFVGQAGLDAQRGVGLPTSFDAKKPFRFNSGDNIYTVSMGGQTLEQKLNSAGRYWVVHQGANGKVVLSSLGYIGK